MLRRSLFTAAAALALSLAAGLPAQAEEAITVEISLKGNAFTPAEVKVPAGKPFVIKMKNENAAPAELEAKDLKIEKVAAGNSEIVVKVKGMPAGKYLFVDEYQEDVAKGYVIVE
ncbi:MAG: cupredoxin domain-containing protein [Hyphomicrobiales bacterium]